MSEQPTYVASFRDRHLQIVEIDGSSYWEVTNPDSKEPIARGGPSTLESAMIDAAQAAGADWGNAVWRRPGQMEMETEE